MHLENCSEPNVNDCQNISRYSSDTKKADVCVPEGALI